MGFSSLTNARLLDFLVGGWFPMNADHTASGYFVLHHLPRFILAFLNVRFGNRLPSRPEMINGIVKHFRLGLVDAAAPAGFVEHTMDVFPGSRHVVAPDVVDYRGIAVFSFKRATDQCPKRRRNRSARSRPIRSAHSNDGLENRCTRNLHGASYYVRHHPRMQ